MSSGIRVGQVWEAFEDDRLTIVSRIDTLEHEAWKVRTKSGVPTSYWADTILKHFTCTRDPVVEEFDRQLAELLGE
jgi:hypothetical protein